MGSFWKPGPLLVPAPHSIEGLIFNKKTQIPLVKDKARHVGEPIAVVIATSRYIAEDALADIVLDVEPLDAVADLEAALEPGAALVHDDLPSNLAAHVIQRRGDFERARGEADVIIQRRLSIDRGAAAAMENRGYVASWDPRAETLTMWATTQAPISLRNGMAGMLGLSEHQVRVIAPFVGGGFGPKIMLFQPEEVLLCWGTKKLGRPIKWIEDRAENFVATTQERGQIHDVEMALTSDGRVLGLKDVFLHDTGAYDPYALTVPLNTQTHTTGPYNIPNFHTEYRVVFTNKMIVTPVRGAGRPQGVFVMERMMDAAARELGLDRTEIRRRNFIPPDAFPFHQTIIGQDFAEQVLDSGNYPATLQMAKDMIGYDEFIAQEQPRLRAEGKKVGIGIACFTESSGVGPYEGARVTVEASGKINLATGVGTQGQGHFTSFAQVAAEQLGVTPADVHVTTGDTAQFHWGTGTFASRGAVVAGNAVNAAALSVRGKILKLASKRLNTPEEELEIADGVVRVADIPEQSISLQELAVLGEPDARVGRAGHRAGPGVDAVLRTAVRRDRERHGRHDRRGRSGDVPGRDQALRDGPRLRHRAEPDDRRRADPRRRVDGRGQLVFREAGVRRKRPDAQCVARRLPGAERARHAASDRDRPPEHAIAAQPDGLEGRWRGRRDPHPLGIRERGRECAWRTRIWTFARCRLARAGCTS